MSEVAQVPQLRFPEFNDSWKSSKLDKIFDITAGGDIDKNNVKDYQDDEYKYPIYANAKKNKGFYGYSNLYKVDKNVVTVAGRGVYLGIAHARDHKFYPIVRLLVLRPKIDLDIYFFEYSINQLNLFIESTGVPQLTAPQFSNYKSKFCTKQEQQKIAAFLTAVDNKIEQLSKKQELLGEYKKGLMQQIFSQAIRFKADDGGDFSDWEEKKLGDVSVRGTSNISANQLEDNNGDYKIYGAAGHLKNIDFYTEEDCYVAIVKDGAGVGRIMLLESKTSVLGTLVIIKAKQGNDINFLYWLIQTINFRKYVVGSTIPHIYYRDYQAEKLRIPSLSEQTKIASFLSSIDNKIEQVGKQLDESKQFKKALLQQMFV
jgi:type I restriction enzyme S subunit